MSVVRLRVFGCGDAFGSGGRFQSCYALEAEGVVCLIDCGASSLIAMRRFGVDPMSVRAILLSHLHGDHFAGIPFLLLDAHFGRRNEDLQIAGPPGTRERIEVTMEALFPGSAAIERRFNTVFTEFKDRREVIIERLAVTPYQVTHASGAPPFALRIVANGKVIAYSGDTEWTESLLEAARGADLFVCEASSFDTRIKYHLDFQTLSAHLGEIGCRRLILTHMSEEMLAHLPRPDVDAAEDGMSIVL
jgi:ribonuclease BN (tRNA processing enzyme)